MIIAVGSAQGSGTVPGRFAGPGAGSVVSRPGLLGGSGVARVTVVSAPPGSGKTVLLRSWIGEAALTDRVACVAVGRG
jgi:LuxR family maltose regulon positive regulatory protein